MTPCTKDYHIFEFWGTDKVTGGIPKGWKCNCGEKKYKEEENKQRAINELFSSLLQKEREAGKREGIEELLNYKGICQMCSWTIEACEKNPCRLRKGLIELKSQSVEKSNSLQE